MTSLSEKNNALDWYRYGLERNDDFFSRFIMHWIAFNWLYAEFAQQSESEKESIKLCCLFYMDKLKKYDAFSTDAIQIFMEAPVIDSRDGEHKYHRKQYQRVVKEHSIVDLFWTMYQVRCNLFHGAKSIFRERDIALVRASAELLEGYLKAILLA